MALIQAVFSRQPPILDVKESAVKELRTIFFQDKFYSLKAHAHDLTVLVYLATWTAVRLGIFSHFASTNLSWCSQSNNLLMHVYYPDSQLLFMSTWSQPCLQSRDCTSSYYCHPKNLSVLLPESRPQTQRLLLCYIKDQFIKCLPISNYTSFQMNFTFDK